MCHLWCTVDPLDELCTVCGVAKDLGDKGPALVCDRPGCIRGAHLGCLDPPLTEVPEGDWFCNSRCKKAGVCLFF